MTDLETLIARLKCKHESCTGGNDYQCCNDCGLRWDYRREYDNDAVKREAVALLRELEAQLAQMTIERVTWKAVALRNLGRAEAAEALGLLAWDAPRDQQAALTALKEIVDKWADRWPAIIEGEKPAND